MKGVYYPVCADNNGRQVIGSNQENDTIIAICHNCTDGTLLSAQDYDSGVFVHTDAEFIDVTSPVHDYEYHNN